MKWIKPGNFGPAMIVWKHPVRPTPLTFLLGGLCEFPYDHSWIFEEGERIPTVAEVAYVDRFSHEHSTCPGGAWCQPEGDPIADLKEVAEMIRDHHKRQVPDWAWIDGIAYRPAGFPPKLEKVPDEVAARWFPCRGTSLDQQKETGT